MAQTAIITGGTGGLGTAVTARFLDDGWRVVVPWVAEAELEHVEKRDGLELIQADLLDESSVGAVAALAGDSTRAVVNLVGGFHAGEPIHQTPLGDLEKQLRLNLFTGWLVTSAALPAMLAAGEGAIVCVAARAALEPFRGGAPYTIAKQAVLGFVDALDADYRAEGIRANAILPSVIDTPGNRAAQPDADPSSWVSPAQLAATIAFLCSPEAAATSGAHVPVYGKA